MRRVVSSILVVSGRIGLSLGLVGVGLGGVTLVLPATPASAAGKKVCTITDHRLVELSGMVATQTGYVVINDSSDEENRNRVFFLDKKCKVKKAVQYSGDGPRDTEDLALSADGKTLWIADTGDNITNTERRPSVVLWSMPADGSARPVLHRLTYPGGKAHDAEALLMADDDTPYIITKTPGTAEIYKPTAPLRTKNAQGVPLAKVGEVRLPKTDTANPFGAAGRLTVTGAARSPDGKRIALRTYADAFEWDLEGGDIIKALTTGAPRVTPLSDRFGEAIAYTPDGQSYVTVSDLGSLGADAVVEILSYIPVEKSMAPVSADLGKQENGPSWRDRLTLDDITYLIASVGVLGALLVGLGVFGILRARRKPGGDGDGVRGPNGGGDGPRAGQSTAPEGVVDPPPSDRAGGRAARKNPGRAQSSGERGTGYPPARPAGDETGDWGRASDGGYGGKPTGGAVYGGKPAGGAGYGGGTGGAVYGGKSTGGAVYGGNAPGGGAHGGQPTGRTDVGDGQGLSGGGYGGGQGASGAYGGGSRSGVYRAGPEDGERADSGRGYQGGSRPATGYDGTRGGQYGQPRRDRNGYPENDRGYR